MEGSRRGTSQGRLLDLVLAGVLSNDDPVERYGELEILGHGSTSEVKILSLHIVCSFDSLSPLHQLGTSKQAGWLVTCTPRRGIPRDAGWGTLERGEGQSCGI